MTDELAKFRRIKQLAQGIADELNLKIGGFSIIPNDDPTESDMIGVVFLLSVESLEPQNEIDKKRIDDEFNLMFGEEFGSSSIEFQDDNTQKLMRDEKEKAEKAIEELKRLLSEEE